jgi:general secretion pathway protein A
MNAPDDTERSALEHYIKAGHAENKPLTSYAKWGKQDVYRHMEPIRLIPPCLGCHGKPKGEPDMLGFEKDGLESGDIIGVMSVTIGVSD